MAFFTDHGDEFVLDSLSSVDGKPVTMIDRADVELPALEEEQKDALPQEEAAALEEWLKGLYPDKFSKVTLGKRLVSGAAVALQSGNDMGPEMRAYMKAMGQEVPESHPQLELNPSNPLVKSFPPCGRKTRNWRKWWRTRSRIPPCSAPACWTIPPCWPSPPRP